MITLNFADLDGELIVISLLDGLNILFLYLSKSELESSSVSGKYLDDLDLLEEKLLKKYFTILASIE